MLQPRKSHVLLLVLLAITLFTFGMLASYLRNPEIDAAVLNVLPSGILAGSIALAMGIVISINKRKPHPSLWLALVFPILGALPALSWVIGDQVFGKSQQWALYVFSDLDNGLSHIQAGSYQSASECRAHGEALMMTPPKLNIKGCAEDTCLADHFFCGQDCATDSSMDSVFISDVICRETTMVH